MIRKIALIVAVILLVGLGGYLYAVTARGPLDFAAINVVQIVVSGEHHGHDLGATQMPSFGPAYSDAEIAAVANYVVARFGGRESHLTARNVAELRAQ